MSRGYSFVKLCLLSILLTSLSCCSKTEKGPPLAYDMHVVKLERDKEKVTICFHGMGGDYQIIDYVEQCTSDNSTLISFNFPDYGLRVGSFDPENTLMGTIDELLPALYILKKAVIEDNFKEVSLYGFSAGGGCVINTLMVLNTSTHNDKLREIGITAKDKKNAASYYREIKRHLHKCETYMPTHVQIICRAWNWPTNVQQLFHLCATTVEQCSVHEFRNACKFPAHVQAGHTVHTLLAHL